MGYFFCILFVTTWSPGCIPSLSIHRGRNAWQAYIQFAGYLTTKGHEKFPFLGFVNRRLWSGGKNNRWLKIKVKKNLWRSRIFPGLHQPNFGKRHCFLLDRLHLEAWQSRFGTAKHSAKCIGGHLSQSDLYRGKRIFTEIGSGDRRGVRF